MKGKRLREKNNRISSIIISLILILFICIFIYSSIQIFKWLKENNDRENIVDDIQNTITIDEEKEDVEKYSIDFNSLKEKNSDTIAWIKVNGTDIEYPVVKTSNNEYYLNHSFDKSYNTGGWIFIDYKNKCDNTDKNMIIYGHNRRDGSLFGKLKNILTDEWQNNHDNFIIPFITENEKLEYQVFSIYRIEKEDYYITTNFSTDKEFKDFIDKIKSRSIKDFGIDVTSDDNILTLSTCANDNKYRVVLHAKKIK